MNDHWKSGRSSFSTFILTSLSKNKVLGNVSLVLLSFHLQSVIGLEKLVLWHAHDSLEPDKCPGTDTCTEVELPPKKWWWAMCLIVTKRLCSQVDLPPPGCSLKRCKCNRKTSTQPLSRDRFSILHIFNLRSISWCFTRFFKHPSFRSYCLSFWSKLVFELCWSSGWFV